MVSWIKIGFSKCISYDNQANSRCYHCQHFRLSKIHPIDQQHDYLFRKSLACNNAIKESNFTFMLWLLIYVFLYGRIDRFECILSKTRSSSRRKSINRYTKKRGHHHEPREFERRKIAIFLYHDLAACYLSPLIYWWYY